MNYKLSPSDLMRKYGLYILVPLAIIFLLSSCIGGVDKEKARLGEEVSLSIGQGVDIIGEDLDIIFIEVAEDSRCPKDVICFWEGRVIAIVEISTGGSSQQLSLSQPGLTDVPSRETYGRYELTYQVKPYPEKAEVKITADKYRLLLIIRKQ